MFDLWPNVRSCLMLVCVCVCVWFVTWWNILSVIHCSLSARCYIKQQRVPLWSRGAVQIKTHERSSHFPSTQVTILMTFNCTNPAIFALSESDYIQAKHTLQVESHGEIKRTIYGLLFQLCAHTNFEYLTRTVIIPARATNEWRIVKHNMRTFGALSWCDV